MKRILAASCVVLHQLHPSVALGCGSTPDMLSAFLPAVDATGVPLDAVLFAASNHSDAITFELRRETPAPSDETSAGPVDAGAGEGAERAAPPRDGEATDTVEVTDAPDSVAAEPVQVPLDVTCYPATGGNLCVAKPKLLLEPGARYSWQTWTNVSGGRGLATVPQGFTTGASIADVGSPQVSVGVDGYNVFTSHPCGQTSSVDMTVTATGLTTPLVVNVEGVTPSYVHEPVVLTPDAAEQPFGLSSPPECFVLETFDVTGVRAEIGEICPTGQQPSEPSTGAPSATSTTSGNSVATTAAGAAEPGDATSRDPDASEADEAPGGVEQRGVDGKSNGGCAVGYGAVGDGAGTYGAAGPNDVGGDRSAAAWLAAVGVVVGLRRMRHRR